MPKIGYTVEEWLTPLGSEDVFEPTIPGFNVPLQISEPTAEEMSRRNIPRPSIPTKMANPAQNRGSSDQELQLREKRQKTTTDALQPDANQTTRPEDSRAVEPKEKDPISQPHIDLTDPNTEAIIRRQFSPSYTMPDGRVLLLNDFVKEEPNLAVTLLRGLALPRDYDQVPTELLPGLDEMCSHLVQVRILFCLQ